MLFGYSIDTTHNMNHSEITKPRSSIPTLKTEGLMKGGQSLRQENTTRGRCSMHLLRLLLSLTLILDAGASAAGPPSCLEDIQVD